MLTYLVKSGSDQFKLLNARRPIDKVLNDPKVNEDTKHKLRLALEVRKFAETELSFTETKNYTSFVQLDRPYVSWIVAVAQRDRLEYKLFHYPMIGKMPYKGFFAEADAKEEAKEYPPDKYDTWVRGVTAFSTLGWFDDPILSSMLGGDDGDLVEVVLHESAHATVFIEDSADFNEQLATFLGQEGTRRYYLKMEGPQSPHLKNMADEIEDSKIFSKFFKEEMESLRAWYKQQTPPIAEDLRQTRFQEMQNHFDLNLKKKLKTKRYEFFGKTKLNNAILLGLGTYVQDLDQFQQLLGKMNGNLKEFIDYCRSLKKTKNPAQSLKTRLSDLGSTPDPLSGSPSSLSQ